MKQFKLTVLQAITVMILVAATFTACKKDPFSEQQALAAQKDLLTLKFSYDLSIAQIGLQIQRSGDSAKIVLQNLINSGASALALAQFNYSTALNLQNLVNLKNELTFRDSLSRASSVNSSLAAQKITDSLARLSAAGGIRSYAVRILDFRNSTPVAGATVRVLPWQASAFVTATSNSDGIATFNNITLDPNSIFYAVDPTAGVTSATTVVQRTWIDAGNAVSIYRYTTATPGPTVSGTLFADADLTNGTTIENAGAARLVSFSGSFNGNQSGSVAVPSVTYQFSASTDIAGKYSVSLPAGITFTISTPASISVNQKQFVNYFEGLDNPFTALPRIDSVATTLAKTGATLATNTSNRSYYFLLPADSLTGQTIPVIDQSNTLINFIATGIRTTGAPVDTLNGGFNISGNSVGFNNGLNSPNGVQNYAASIDPLVNYKIRLNTADAGPVNLFRVQDTLPITVVDLSGKLIATAPQLVMITTTAGKLLKIELKKVAGQVLSGACGSFNITSMGGLAFFTGTNSPIFNRAGTIGTGNATNITVSTGNVTSNFYYTAITGRTGSVVPR